MKILKPKLVILILIMSILMSACSQTTDLYVYANDSWKIDSQIQYDEGLIDLVGRAISAVIGSELGILIPIPRASSAMDMMGIIFNVLKTEFRKQHIEFTWQKTGDTFALEFQADTTRKLDQMTRDFASLLKLEDGSYHLQMEILDFSDLDPSLEGYEEILMSVFDYTFTLHASQIIESNADQETRNKAIWYNPNFIDVVFKPISPFPWNVLGSVCGGIFILSLSIYLIQVNRKRPCPTCGARISRRHDFCDECGMGIQGNGYV